MGTNPTTPPPTDVPVVIPGNTYPNGQPSSPGLYVGFNDYLQVTFISTLTSQNVGTLHGRLIRRDGTIMQLEVQLYSAAAFNTLTVRLPLCEGWLVSAAVTASALVLGRGNLFAVASIVRSTGSGYVASTVLLADYVTQAKPVGWPGSRIVDPTDGPGLINTVALSAPPAGSDWNYTITPGTRQHILSVGATLNTSATVANRQPNLTINGIPLDLWYVAPGFNATAGASYVLSWLPGCAGLLSSPPAYTLPLPEYIFGGSIFSIATKTANIQAGDTWGNIYIVVEQWLDAN